MKKLLFILLIFNVTTLIGQTKQYNGTWTKIDTTYEFDFELTLKVNESNRVEGYFNWTLVRYDENDTFSKHYYEKKVGMKGTEYVKGTYNHAKREFILRGYKKDDPNSIIGLDIYNLKIDESGNIGGTTKANNSWLGRIKGEQTKVELL